MMMVMLNKIATMTSDNTYHDDDDEQIAMTTLYMVMISQAYIKAPCSKLGNRRDFPLSFKNDFNVDMSKVCFGGIKTHYSD